MSGIVVYEDLIFPQDILLDALSGTAGRKNDRGMNQAGFAYANVVRDITMRTWQIAIEPLFVRQLQEVFAINEVTDYGAFGFLLEDPIDSTVTAAQGALIGYLAGVQYGVSGYGNGTPNYSLQKVYTARGSTRKRARDITRPKGTPAILRGGSPVVVGVAAGNIALSAGPVKVAFVADASRTVTAVTVGATTQITLATAIPGFVVGGRLWLQDLTGADAALLNSLSHEITAITGGGLNVYTLAINTAGKTITAAGSGKKYPQPDEALTWSGPFYVPVQFRDDELAWELTAGGSPGIRMATIPSTYLDEIREA